VKKQQLQHNAKIHREWNTDQPYRHGWLVGWLVGLSLTALSAQIGHTVPEGKLKFVKKISPVGD